MDATSSDAASAGGRGLPRALAGFSLGLGAAHLARPTRVARFIGVRPTNDTRSLLQGIGLQELIVGTAMARSRRPAPWLWARVVGDVGHLLLLRSAARDRSSSRDRVERTTALVAGAALVDLVASVRHSRGGSGRPTGPVRTTSAITVNRPPEEVYRRWRRIEQLPAFSAHLLSVESVDETRSHWIAAGPGGSTVEWDAEIIEDLPAERLSWRSVPGAKVANSGVVGFRAAPGGRGTEVTVELEYDVPGGRLGRAVAAMLGERPDQQAADDLRRFKQIVETGEVVRSSASPEGSKTARQWNQEPAR